MLNFDQLNEVYQQDGRQEPKLPAPKPVKAPAKTRAAPAKAGLPDRTQVASRKPDNYGTLANVNLKDDDLTTFLDGRSIPNPQTTGTDLNLMMGEAQSGWNKLGRKIGNLIPNIAAGIVDMVGNVGQLATEWGDERDYHNALNDIADSIKNPFGENYKRSNDTWAIGDPTWWIDNIGNVTEMAASFAIGGAGAGRLLGMGAKALSRAGNLGATSSMLLRGAAQLGTAGIVSYAESAQAGAEVYKQTYEHQFKKLLSKGLNPTEAANQAKHIAAQSAASTAQLGTLLTMGLNVGAYAPWFRNMGDDAIEIISKRVAQADANATRSQIAEQIRGLSAKDYADKVMHHYGLQASLREMAAEGGEEILQQFAQATGTAMGEDGRTKGFFEQFGELEKLLDRTANSEGLLAFTLGAVFGGVQKALIGNVIPVRADKYGEDGQPIQRLDEGQPMVDKNGVPVMEKTWTTARSRDLDMSTRKFNSVRDAVAADFKHFDELETELLKAKKPEEVEAIKAEMFATGQMHAVKSGLTEPWKKTYQQIADMTPEQAMEKGYAVDENDTSYQAKAQEAIADLDTFTTMYDKLANKYGAKYNGNDMVVPYVDMVFARHVDLHYQKKTIDNLEKELAESEEKTGELPEGLDELSATITKFNEIRNSAIAVEKQLIEDHKALLSGDKKKIARILKKYRTTGYGDGDFKEGIKELDLKLRAKQDEMSAKVKDHEDRMLNSVQYTQWLTENPDGKFNDFIKELNEQSKQTMENKAKRHHLENAKIQLEVSQKNLDTMLREKNEHRFVKKADEWQKQMAKEIKKAHETHAAVLSEMVKDKSTLNKLQAQEMNRIAAKYLEELKQVNAKIEENNKEIEELQKDMEGKNIVRDIFVLGGMRLQLKKLQKANKILKQRAKRLASLYEEHKVATAPEIIEKEEVTEEDGDDHKDDITVDTDADKKKEEEAAKEEEKEEEEEGEEEAEEDEEFEFGIELGEDPSFDPVQEFLDILNSVPPPVRKALEKFTEGLEDGSIPFTLKFLNKFVERGDITQNEANKALQAAQEYVTEMQKDIDEDKTEPEEEPDEEEFTADIAIGSPDSPIVLFADEEVSQIMPEPESYHAGYKIIEAAETGATSTLGYHEGMATRRGKDRFVKVQDPTTLNDTINQDILHPDKLLPGTDIEFVVDTEYDGPKHITDSLTWDENQDVIMDTEKGEDYLDEDGKVAEKGVANVPIKVIDKKTGKTLFHLRTMDWLTMKFPNTTDYRNVVEWLKDEDGNLSINNLEIQKERLMQIRTAIVNRFNNKQERLSAKMGKKNTGRLILNHKVEKLPSGKIKSKIVDRMAYNKSKPEESMLPDTSLTLVIAEGEGILNSGLNYQFDKPVEYDISELPRGAVGAMVPAANGSFMYAALIGNKLAVKNKPSIAINSTVRAIELYMKGESSPEVQAILTATGFDVTNIQDLKSFINQYFTYTQLFPDAATFKSDEEGFVFSIDDSKVDVADRSKHIKVGFRSSGQKPVYAKLGPDGTLTNEFQEILRQGYEQRSTAVVYTNAAMKLKGINSSSKFTFAGFTSKGWKFDQYNTYNEYVKSFSKTAVYGRNQLSDGTYVYTANPHLPMIFNDDEVTNTVKQNNTANVVAMPTAPSFQAGANLLDELMNMSKSFTREAVPEIGTAPDKSTTLTTESLREIYNFTPEAQRNGKTVTEVYNDLAGRGHTFIPEGYNPFSRCL